MTTNQTQIAVGSAFKKLTFSLFLLFTCVAFAQVGVGTQTPATTLDVVGASGNTPGALNTIDGIAVPVVTDDMTTTTTNGSKVSQLVYSNHAASTGFYFWDGTAWTAMSGGGAAGPDFTVGNILTRTLDGTNHDFSADTDSNVLIITTTAGFGTDAITLPTPATNTGRIIVVKNLGGKALSVTNAFNNTLAVINTRSTAFVSDGTNWTALSN